MTELWYKSLEIQNERYQTIMHLLTLYPESTDSEITRLAGYSDPNKIRPRRRELEQHGFVVLAGKRPCQVTGKLAMTWRLA